MYRRADLGGFENVTKKTFEGFANTLFENVTKGTLEGFENVTGDKYNSFMDAVETPSLVEVRNKTLVEIENITKMEMMDPPAPEFM